MTRRRVEIVQNEGESTFSFRGWQAHKLAVEATLRPTFSGVRGWVADTKRLPDLLAYLQMRHIAVEITGTTVTPQPTGSPSDPVDVPPGYEQLDLFGGDR